MELWQIHGVACINLEVRCPKSGRSTIVHIEGKVTLPDVREFHCSCCGGNLKEGCVIKVFGNNCTWGYKGKKK